MTAISAHPASGILPRKPGSSQGNARIGISPRLVLQTVAITRRQVSGGQHIYRAGDDFQALHLLNSGFAKSTLASPDGREKVTGFHMRGELLGLESIGTAAHACDAVALDDAEVWRIEYADLLSACSRHPELQRELTATLAAQIRFERNWMLSWGTLCAEQRVAMLLLELGERLHALGFSATHFLLRMTRAEIGSFLGLQLETVTRAMTLLDQRGLIAVLRRDIRILEPESLREMIAVPSRTH